MTVGVDLGTTTSSIGVVRDGRPHLIPIDGDALVPSVVCFLPDGGVVVGRAAVELEAQYPSRTIRSAKRRMGSEYVWDIGDRKVTPVDVAAAVLKHLIHGARSAGVDLGDPVRAVLTVPAWFTQAQRQDTRRAGEIAGMEVVRLIHEPTAAALAHAHAHDVRRTALVYDFGGGTFDVSLVDQDGPVIEVRASHGDTWLGGDDVDEGLLQLVFARLRRRDGEARVAALEASVPARKALRAEVEAAKVRLTSTPATEVQVSSSTQAEAAAVPLTLADLEEVVLPLFARTTAAVDRVLADAGRTVRPHAEDGSPHVDTLLLVGGSSLLPLVWTGLRKRYGLEGDTRVPPQRAVALGIAVQAGLIDGADVQGALVDVTPYALSVGMACGGIPGFPSHFVCEVVTPKHASLPSRHVHLVRTGHPTQERIRLPVYQGSDPDPRQNTILGEIVMTGLPPAPEGQLFRPIAVELAHDLDGTVQITVIDQLTGTTGSGNVVADGAEQAALRATWEAFVAEHDLLWGDPLLPPTGASSTDRRGPASLPQAEALFAQVRAASDALIGEHGAALIEPLVACATEGAAALVRGDISGARQAFERLQDHLFEAGIYL